MFLLLFIINIIIFQINCYEKCTFYYYYDNYRHHYCTNDKKCPNGFNKIIPEKKRCIDNCQKDNTYNIEYYGTCYDKCPPGTQPKENNIGCDAKSDLLIY